MKRLLTICMMLSLTLGSVSWGAAVNPPPGAPSWWNSEDATFYAYAWGGVEIVNATGVTSPPDDAAHWASNFLLNTAFLGDIDLTDHTISIDLDNVYRTDLYKKIYIYLTGTTTSTIDTIDTVLDTDSGVFSGVQEWNIDIESGEWSYVLQGEIHPQPDYVRLSFTVPGMTSVTNIWAGEVCVPEPATMGLLSIGALSLIRRKKTA